MPIARDEDDGPSGRYHRRDLLGEGGMAEVFLCEDRQVGRDVAMKVTRRRQEDFLEEAKLQARLEHPSIVPVYDVGLDERGVAFFTMKRVRGVTLHELLTGPARPSLHRLLTAFCQICLTVEYAHANGVLHRDLKPSNVMLGDFGELYVLDWGIATSVKGEDDASFAGTLGYMAPEQLVADTSVDHRADVYALGAILFEIVTGGPLHAGESFGDLVESTLAAEHTRPSMRAPTSDVPPELDAICVKATATSPEDRYETVRELHDAVERFLEGDRDLARRRELAQAHAARARALAAGALADSEADRVEALRAAARALALDASNGEARATLVRLLTAPPTTPPPAALADLDRAAGEYRGACIRLAAYAVLAAPLCLVLFACRGVLEPELAWGLGFGFIALGLMGLRDAGRAVVLRRPPVRVILLCALAISVASYVAGSLVLVPVMATFFVVAVNLLHPSGARRPLVLGSAVAAVLVPLALEGLGVIPPSFRFENGSLVLLPRLVTFDAWTLGTLVIVTIAAIVMIGAWVVRFRNVLTEAERRVHVQAWQLKQLAFGGEDEAEAEGED